jgi:hypothetical protein
MFDAVANADERAPTSPPCHEDQMAFECMGDARLALPIGSAQSTMLSPFVSMHSSPIRPRPHSWVSTDAQRVPIGFHPPWMTYRAFLDR